MSNVVFRNRWATSPIFPSGTHYILIWQRPASFPLYGTLPYLSCYIATLP
ncbi:uncharacterized protein LACBIDRAFT_300644 [Laccaria bicolor S238N-H82]|uniref:Predicted protein n=1 Tax=Laccaria bicolor (strain S238N-H82 / ATCC MYA-4686) TaxID=486041 RepID=B0CPS9_LACBS|nr:uncharacterized protein LACBIDRAFT_300644 [Laccaria bicolor S238N-H82]EDR15588.1 predicted protein [Laccaria bicolor S238N-H82]|eukprot:XP_001873796.1 predicted protein [Laccaria bicolor S238N-H82]